MQFCLVFSVQHLKSNLLPGGKKEAEPNKHLCYFLQRLQWVLKHKFILIFLRLLDFSYPEEYFYAVRQFCFAGSICAFECVSPSVAH